MNFLLIIGSKVLYTYEFNGKHYVPLFIEGSDSFPINESKIKESIKEYIETLVNEKNLDSDEEPIFDVLVNGDSAYSNRVLDSLKKYVAKVIPLNDILKNVIVSLASNKKLLIETYGVNYEGYSYKLSGDSIIQEEYDLLSYKVECKDLVERIK